jgi:FMN-dependent NADH-azoreductase
VRAMKNTLLVINSSGRVTRSITRRLTTRFANTWRACHPEGIVLHRDVGLTPPPVVDEAWIAAAFADAAKRSSAALEALRLSEMLINELEQADVIVVGAPIYNFGMPAQLKAYFDQVVRVGRTFGFSAESEEPYRPLLPPKPVVIVTAAGDGSLFPGGALAHLNSLEPHLRTVLGFIGQTDLTFVRVGYDEFQDDRLARSLAAAEAKIDELAGADLPPQTSTVLTGLDNTISAAMATSPRAI